MSQSFGGLRRTQSIWVTDFISTLVELMTNKVFNKDGVAEIGHVFDHSFIHDDGDRDWF
jgi:hypothetical protein